MNRLVQAAASHMDSYVTVRKASESLAAVINGALLSKSEFMLWLHSVQSGSTREELEEQVLLRLGANLHPAMKGHAAALDYFKGLVQAALPLLLPAGTSESR